METLINICLTFGLALTVFALNLKVQSLIIANPSNTDIGSRIVKWGWWLCAVGILWVLIGAFLLLCAKLQAWTWISVGITLSLLAIAIIIQGKKVTTNNLERLGETLGTISHIVVIIGAIIVVAFSILLLIVVSKNS
jgi:hypothetical protein